MQTTKAVIDEKEIYSSLNNEVIKKYNMDKKELNDNDEKEEETLPTPPVILYSDILKNNEQQQEKKEEIVDFTSRTSVVSNGTRLSKYNFLAQAFSQMRESYVGGGGGTTQKLHDLDGDDEPRLPKPLHTKNSSHRTFHDSMVLTQYDFEDAKNPPSIPSTIPSTPDIRESTITVATLHAPLFKNHQHHPMPRSNTPLLYTNQHRDSTLSDVSQFSTWPRSMEDEETGTLHQPITL
ncbi:hypothetical protein K501DRAFT_282285 [Backusella circina FSU 941]|nr:hypothetical protein K501DRAFT_282285 [Backusella circina FSU 941]